MARGGDVVPLLAAQSCDHTVVPQDGLKSWRESARDFRQFAGLLVGVVDAQLSLATWSVPKRKNV
jgi:hypothetical protein